MSSGILVMGHSGTGKSTSLRNLPPEETFIFNVVGKPLPFRGWKKNYSLASKDNPEGNMFNSDKPQQIISLMNKISKDKEHIKYIVIDDSNYIMTNEFFDRAFEKGYDKFAEIGANFWSIVDASLKLREDLFVIFISHIDENERGVVKMKTIGKMVEEKGCPIGRFTYVFHSVIRDGEYMFQTNNDGLVPAKTPMGYFDEMFVPNDMMKIIDHIIECEGE